MKIFFCALIVIAYATTSNAQESYPSPLFLQLQQRDSLLFDRGFNNCDLSSYDTIVAEDLKFYHDLGGITNGRAAFITSVKNNICGSNAKLKRELVSGSLKVFPLSEKGALYGALQEGVHIFYAFENNKWRKAGIARFVHLWIRENNVWKLKQVISYDHKSA